MKSRKSFVLLRLFLMFAFGALITSVAPLPGMPGTTHEQDTTEVHISRAPVARLRAAASARTAALVTVLNARLAPACACVVPALPFSAPAIAAQTLLPQTGPRAPPRSA